jgi:diguanylate cyclase (GGDEF)-like protein
MVTLLQKNYLLVGGMCVAALFLLLVMSPKEKRSVPLILAVTFTMVAIACENACTFLDHSPYRVLDIIMNVLGFSVSPFIPLLLNMILYPKDEKISLLVFLPALVTFGFSFASAFYPLIFYVDPMEGYMRGPWFFVFIIAYLWNVTVLFSGMARIVFDRYHSFQKPLVFLYFFLIIGSFIEIVNPEVHVTWLCVTISLLLYNAFLSEMNNVYDVMTGVFNRWMFELKLAAYKEKEHVVITMLDIDDFKYFNDTYGHQQGDVILATVGYCLLDSYAEVGEVYRIGGDEFCVLSDQDADTCHVRAELFVRELDRRREHAPLLPTVSYGIACYDKAKGISIHDVQKEADAALYESKRRKKGLKDPSRNGAPLT